MATEDPVPVVQAAAAPGVTLADVDAYDVPLTGGGNKRRQAVTPGAGAIVAISAAPPALTPNSDASVTFSEPVNHVLIQNNSNQQVNYNFDAAASAGTFLLPANSPLIGISVWCTTLHLYCAAAVNINGTTGGNIVIQGRT